MQKDILEKIVVEKKAGSLVVFTGEIPFTELEKHHAHAVTEIAKEIEIDGFRKGHIPESVLVRKVGEMAILTEMAERVLSQVYPELVALHKLDVVGYPNISITKLALANPLGFSISVAVVPEVSLPDYIQIAKDVNGVKESKEVTEEEITKQINDILRQKIAYERLQEQARKNADRTRVNAESTDETRNVAEKSQKGADETQIHAEEHVHGENCDHDHEGHDHTQTETPVQDDIVVPELTDEYVKGLGKPDQFKTADDFKNKIREHLTIEKARDVVSRHRAKITDSIIEKTIVELPQVMIDAEINQMFAQMEEDLTRAQLKMDDYLGHIKKTKDDLKKEWTPSAEKRAKLQLVLNAIAKKDNITADPSLVDHEVSHLLEQYKDADEKRVRIYVESVLTNDAVMKKLEEAK